MLDSRLPSVERLSLGRWRTGNRPGTRKVRWRWTMIMGRFGALWPVVRRGLSGITRFLTSHRRIPHALTVASIAVLAVCLLSAPELRVTIAPDKMEHFAGHSYRVAMQPETWLGYSVRPGKQSNLRLREDGRRLNLRNTSREDIAGLGGGRFRYESGYLYFSSSDGSNPRANGRVYVARMTATPTTNAKIVLWSLALLCGGLTAVEYALRDRAVVRRSWRFSPAEISDFGWSTGAKILSWLMPRTGFSERRRAARIKSDTHHILELDGIRGYACLTVLLAHCVIGILVVEPGTALSSLKNYTTHLLLGGVDLFSCCRDS